MTRIQPRRGTAAAWTSANPTLAVGELGLETDTGRLKRGDGATAWTSLAYTESTIGHTVVTAADAAAVTTALGATVTGRGVFTAADGPTARTAIGAVGSSELTSAVTTAVGSALDAGAGASSGPVPKRYVDVQAYNGIQVSGPIVALRLDDSETAVRDTAYPLLTARGLPVGIAPSMGLLGTTGMYSAADALTMQRGGMDVMAQWDEATIASDSAFRAHSITLADNLETANPGLRISTFTESGVWDLTTKATYGGDSETFLESAIGREFQSRFIASEGYANDGITAAAPIRPIPPLRRYGASHIALDSVSSLATWQQKVEIAKAMNGAVEILIHPRNIGTGGNITLADFTTFLDYLVTERDAGRISVLTPTAALFATRGARNNLLGNGALDMYATTPGNTPYAGGTAGGAGTGRTSGGQSIVTTSADGIVLAWWTGSYLRTVEVGGWAKAQSGTGTARLLLRAFQGATTVTTVSLTAAVTTSGWTPMTGVIGCDPSITSLSLKWYATTGSVLWDDLRMFKA